MKLYTEEQVRKAMLALNDIKYMYHSDDDIFDSLTPIELPSDEEIDKKNQEIFGKDYIVDMGTNLKYAYLDAFEVGAKWVIEQIKQQGK